MIHIAASAKRKLAHEMIPYPAIGIRIRVQDSGCSGLAYAMEYCYEKEHDDIVVTQCSKRLYIDRKSMVYLHGSDMHYRKTEFEEGYEFVNPNVTSECGCGESFYVA